MYSVFSLNNKTTDRCIIQLFIHYIVYLFLLKARSLNIFVVDIINHFAMIYITIYDMTVQHAILLLFFYISICSMRT